MKRLVIFSMDTFGDITLRQSFFKGLLDLGYQITVVVQARFTVLIPFLDARLKWISTPLSPKHLSIANQADVLALKTEIAALHPDALVSPEYFYTDLEQWLMLLFPKLPRFGFENPSLIGVFKITQSWVYLRNQGKRGPFNRLVKGCDPNSHEFVKTQAIFKKLTGQELKALPEIILTHELLTENESFLNKMGLKPGEYIIAALGGNTNASIKLLPAETCAKTLIYIQRHYALPAIITGVKSEEPHLLKIANLCEAQGISVKIWLGTAETFGTLLALIRQARFYYGSDTGAMHFAAAMDIPIVAHFGGGGWPRFTPLAAKSYIVNQNLPCFQCNWHCWANTPLCINLVAPEKLYQAVDWIMRSDTTGQIQDEGLIIEKPFYDLIAKRSKKFQRKRMLKLGLSMVWRNITSLGALLRK